MTRDKLIIRISMRFHILDLYVLKKSDIKEFLNRIMDKYELFAPIKKNGKLVLGKISELSSVILSFKGHTLIPVKKLFFPEREILFEYKVSKNTVKIFDKLSDIKDIRRVMVGVRACDLKGLEILDKVFLGEFHDPYYDIRRKNTIIIALICLDIDDYCFCYYTKSGPDITDGYDLCLTDIGEYYLVSVGSEIGNSLIKENHDLFRKAHREQVEKKNEIVRNVINKIKANIQLPFFDEIYNELIKNYESDKWKEISSLCLSCGKCNFVCPTCHCFDVHDEYDPLTQYGMRVRVWDSCHFLSFTRVASGEIFRKERESRVKQRIYHKIVYSVNEIGEISCTGCGRCISVCPVGIDIREIVKELSR